MLRYRQMQHRWIVQRSIIPGDPVMAFLSRRIWADFYLRLQAAMEQLPETSAWLSGSRPSLRDFGLYGQLSHCAIDPTASGLMRRHAPGACQWTQTLDDACGVDGEWAAPASLPPTVGLLLDLVAKLLLPLLLAHSRACAVGDPGWEAAIQRGRPAGPRTGHRPGRPAPAIRAAQPMHAA